MVCNNVILSQPEAGTVVSHQIPDDISARLNFTADDIDALQLNDAGSLVISFADGGTLNITNFETLIENGNLLFLEDGTLVDQSLLTTAALSPSALNNIDTAAGAAINGDAIRIGQPAANTTQEIALQGGQKYICDFDPSNAANVEVINGNMVLTFNDGSQVVINDFSQVMAGDLPAELTVADGTAVDSESLLTGFTETIDPTEEVLEVAEAAEVDDIAAQVANIQPAAGGDGSDIATALNQLAPEAGDGGLGGNTGFGFASSFSPTPFNSPDDTGPIGPTALQFTAPSVNPINPILPQDNTVVQDDVPALTNPFEVLDETNLVAGNLAVSGQVVVDFGADGPGLICSTGNLVISGSEAGNAATLFSGGVPVVVDFDQATNTYTATANGTTIFTFVLDENDGSYTFEQFGPLDHADPNNDNDQINLDFNFVTKDADGDETAGIVRIIVRDDAPVALSQVAQQVDETNFIAGSATVSGRFFATPGQDVDGEYCGTDSFNATGSVAGGALTSNGVAVVVTFDAAINTYTGSAGALTVFTVVIDSATGEYDFTIFAPLDHADSTDPNDQIALNFGVKLVDFDGDSAEGFVTINVLDDAPVIEGGAEAVDETDGLPRMADGTIFVDFGEDGAGVLRGNNDFDVTGSVDNGVLTSNGVPVIVTFDVATDTYTGTAGTDTVFTFTIDPVTGDYEFEQFAPLDHADAADPNDSITLSFGVEAVDNDGDVQSTVVTVDVLDDAPLIVRDTVSVDETDLSAGPIILNDQVDVDFGEDGPGEICGNDAFNARQDLNGPVLNLTSGGVAVDVTFDVATNTYTGVAGATTIFTLEINSDGTYTYTQNEPLDHPDGTDPNDEITLNFGVKATDFDGDESARSIRVRVADDGPEVIDAQGTVDETNITDTVIGTVASNFGEDGAGEFNPTGTFASSGSQANGALTSGGVPVVVTFDSATGTYTGVAGTETIFTMVINDDGSYKFDLLGTLDHADATDPNDIINLDFGVEIEDFDGDTDTGKIRIRVQDDVPTIGDSSGDVDETNLDQGPLVFKDVIDTNFGAELGDVKPNGETSSSEPLSHCGFPVVITQTATGYQGIANGVVVFTLDIDPATGDYTYTQNEALDHSDTTNPDDVLSITFGILVESVDGDTDDGVIVINIADDGPVAVDDINSAEEDQLITGDLLANDELSQDGINTGDNTVTNVRFNGVDFPVPANGSETITGDYGVLTINSDGTYSYQANDFNPDGVDSFEYTLTDKDGDSDTATLNITVTPDGDPVAVDQDIAVDETNLTPGPVVMTGDLDVNFGPDGSGMVMPTDVTSFAPSGSLAGGALTSGGVPVVVTLNGNTYTGMAGSVTVFTVTINAQGTYDFRLFEPLDHADSTDPNDVISLDFGIKVLDADGDTAEGTFTVLVHDDAPVARDDGQTNVNEGQTVTGDVTTNDEFGEDTPNTIVEVRFGNTVVAVPDGGSASIDGQFGTFTLNSDGTYSYTANSNDPDGVDEFTYVLEDFDGDRDTAEISFKAIPQDDQPIIAPPPVGTVDETDGFDMVTGRINVNFGNDAPGSIDPNNVFASSVPNLTSCGEPVTVRVEGNTYIGESASGPVFTLEVLDNGEYKFTQLAQLDHPDTTNPNDVINLDFGITATDADGDKADTTLRIRVLDDGPEIGSITNAIDETSFGNVIAASGIVPHDFGQDGAGEITPNGLFQALFQRDGSPVTLSSGGNPIAVTETATGYVGTANGQTIFTLTINPATGAYSYRQFDAIDHPDGTDPNDVIWLKFYVDITDKDGDTDTGTIIIDVADDAPTVGNASSIVDETGGLDTVTGSVAADAGADGSVQGVVGNNVFSASDATLTSNGQAVRVTYNANNGTYTGTAGGRSIFTLKINDDGSYTFRQLDELDHPNSNSANDNIALRFGVEITDGDGDSDTGTITINVRDDGPNARNDVDALSRTETRETGNVLSNDSFGQDGAGRLVTTGTFVGNFGTLTLNANGSYTYVRSGRAGGTDRFNYTIEDNDGDRDTAQLTINVTANPAPPPPPPPPFFGGGDGGDGTPLVFDLDGDGIELTNTENGVLFDVDVDGVAEQTAWVSGDDGLLALDRNNDGQITDRSELFGDTDGFEDGFQNLSSYDSNNDGVIDANDDVYEDLRIWQDVNQDGVSDDGELLTLAQIGIVSINLNASLPEDFYIAGNLISHISEFTFADGSTGTVVDAVFNYDNTSYATDGVLDTFLFQAVANEAAEAMADIVGFNAEEGDAVDLSLLIDSENDVTEAIQDFVFVSETEDGDTIISVDVDGADGPAEAREVARLQNVTGQTLDDLVDNGNIIV